MAENEGLHIQLTADAQGYISTINNAKNKLTELSAETKILKQGEKDIQKALAESKKKYGENSAQVDRLTADLADNAREQEKLKQEIKEVNDTLDKATKEYKEYGNSAKQSFESVSQQSQKTAETLKSGFNMVKGLIVGYAGKKLYEVLIGSNADYEQSLTSFEVLLQSADKADAMMQKLEKMGASTPFELSDLTAATEQLLAYGTAEADVEARLQQLGDLSKGNAERFESMTNAYGRMLAKGKVSLEELNMFTEAGVPILEELQNQYGVTGEEMFKMISDGKVGVEEINSAMKSMTSEGGKFFGMMEKQSKTLDGMMSTMSDNVTMFGRLVGEETFEILKTELESLLATINEMAESGELQEIAHDLGQGIATAVTFIIDLVKWLYEMKDILIASAAAVLTYKTSFTVLNTAVSAFNVLKEAFNIITGKTVVCKNLETGATFKLTAAEAAEITTKNSAIKAQTAFNAVCNANVIVAAASAVFSLVAAFVSYNAVAGDAVDNTNELLDSYNQTAKSIWDSKTAKEGEINATVALKDELFALNEELQSETISQERANEAKREFNAYAEKLAKEIPSITDYLYDETGAINVQTEAVEGLIDAYYELSIAKAEADAYQDLRTEAFKARAQASRELEGAEYNKDYYKKQIIAEARKSNFADGMSDEEIMTIAYDSPSFFGPWTGIESAVKSYKAAQQQAYESSAAWDAAQADIEAYDEEGKQAFNNRLKLEAEYADMLGLNDDGRGDSSGSGSTGGTRTASGTQTKGKSDLELAKAAYEARRKQSDEYIKQRELLDDWGEDSRIKALQRIMVYTDEALNDGVLNWDEYCKEIGDLSTDLYTELKDMVEEEKKRVKEQLEEEYELEKQLMEDKLEFRKQLYDKEIEYLDELKAKREDEKEDEDYAERMARLQAKLEYEMDDDNRRALQKEIAELQEEIDDTEFDRDIERKKSVLTNRKNSDEEKTQTEIDKLSAYYEERMSDINIAETVYKNLDFGKFKEMGELMGENLAAGMTGILDPYINAINKLVTLGSNVQSPANNTVTTTDNSISVTQYNNGVSNVPTPAETKKAIDDYMFLKGRLG